MASTIQVDNIKDIGGNTIISSDGSGTFTSNLSSNVSSATGTLPIANGGTGATTLAAAGLQRLNAKPFFINGSMAVAQRGTSFSHPDTNNSAYPVDRFSFQTGSIGVYTSTQETLSSGASFNNGFRNAARIDCTTAQASPAAGDYFWFEYRAESQDCLAWKKGTTNATIMTLSFWVKSNKTGTAQVNLRDDDNDRMVCALYTISSGDTWEKKVVTFPMETSYPMNNDNGTGFRFEWPLGGGSTYSSGTAPTAWEARIDADVAANNLAINDSTSNDWAITGIQAEVGTYTSATIPPFQFESFGDNLLRCQRYFQTIADGSWSSVESIAIGYFHTSSRFIFVVRPIVEMRSNPSLTTTMGTNYVNIYRDDGEDNNDNIETYVNVTKRAITMTCDDNVSGTKGQGGWVMLNNASAFVGANSEL